MAGNEQFLNLQHALGPKRGPDTQPPANPHGGPQRCGPLWPTGVISVLWGRTLRLRWVMVLDKGPRQKQKAKIGSQAP